MTVTIKHQNNEGMTLEVHIPFNRSMLNSEKMIQESLNDAGRVATSTLLKTFDTDGSDIRFGTVKMTSKGLVNKTFQTPYGEVDVRRHLYQTSGGGTTFCPMEQEARIILTSTPQFAAQIAHKVAAMGAPQVQQDLERNHGRKTIVSLIQRLTEAVATVVEAKEEQWTYHVPELKNVNVAMTSIGMDGTCICMFDGNYRQAMVGTIALYDQEGERLHTTYIAAEPEYGKEAFKARLTQEIGRAKALYPEAIRIGLADGAHDNWSFLEMHTDKQTLDFYHATEYLSGVSESVFSDKVERKNWLDKSRHNLKHEPGAAAALIKEMEKFEKNCASMRACKTEQECLETLGAAITYFKNNNDKGRMDYAESRKHNFPIGSGVTEAACKTIVKQRLCQSGMKWKSKGAGMILSLRALSQSAGRWDQFWSKVNQYGLPARNNGTLA